MYISTILDIITTVFLLATLIVLIIYTYQTYRLRQETTKQTELSLRPYVILVRASYGTHRLNFENIGLSHALDVSIDILHINVFLVRFQPCNLVKRGKKEAVRALPFEKDKESEKMIKRLSSDLDFPYFKGFENVKDYPLTVRYEDIEGKRYYTQLEVRVLERKVIIKKSGRDKKPRS